MKKFFSSLYLRPRFFIAGGICALLFFASFGFSFLYPIALFSGLAILIAALADISWLYTLPKPLIGGRNTAKVWSIGEENKIDLHLKNISSVRLKVGITDEIPFQFQKRDFNITIHLQQGEKKVINYYLRPLERGEYDFGNLFGFCSTLIGLFERRIAVDKEMKISVFPSIVQMRKLELKAFSKAADHGIKLFRRIGNTLEFEEIKNYSRGDDYRGINWKATGKKASLMVNRFQEERSQQLYCILDKSRIMDLVSDGLSLLDHSINASLVLSNIALQKHDKAGLITFSDKFETFIKAENSKQQIKRVLESLYNEKAQGHEANYEMFYHGVKRFVKGRSLLVIFTNFESTYGMERALPVLRKLNRMHPVLVIFFQNEEINDFTQTEAENLEGVYDQVIAEKYLFEKQQIARQLRNYGIHTLLTKPGNLAVNTINKYLELKSRGLI